MKHKKLEKTNEVKEGKEKKFLKKIFNVRNILIVLLLGIFIFTSTKLGLNYLDLRHNEELNNNIIDRVLEPVPDELEPEKETIKINFEELLSINKDTVGWINYNQNKINYPIVQGPDNAYYLRRAIDGKKNNGGTIFMDWRNKGWDDQNVILFGHAMSDGSMFGTLKDLDSSGYFDTLENNYITIVNSNNETLTYQIFSHYTIEKEEYYITPSFEDTESFQTFIDTLLKRSTKDFGVKVTTNNHILTLSTCSGVGGTSKRRVIHAIRLENI